MRKKRSTVLQELWHDRDPSLLKLRKCLAQAEMYSPSSLMVTSLCDRNILEWDVKQQINNPSLYYVRSARSVTANVQMHARMSLPRGSTVHMLGALHTQPGLQCSWQIATRKERTFNFVHRIQQKIHQNMVILRLLQSFPLYPGQHVRYRS